MQNMITDMHNMLNKHLESCTPGQDQENRIYWYVRTSTYWYMSVQDLHTSTYCYVLVRTLNKTCGFPIHPGSSLRVKYNSVHLLCKRYDSMMSNFKNCKVQVIQVHIGMYWYVLVRTCIDINHKHASMESHSIPDRVWAAFLCQLVSTARLTCS